MPTNVHPEYIAAEKQFYAAQTNKEKLRALEEMMRTMPQHKSAEALRKNIRTRYRKLKEKLEKERQKARARGKQQKGIKKAEMQAVLIGLANSGKSSVFKCLTNKDVKIAGYGFTTTLPEQAILDYEGCQIQIVDLPPIESENFDISISNTADTILLVTEKIEDIEKLKKFLGKTNAKQIVILNKIDLHNDEERRKIEETLKSRRAEFAIVSAKTGEGIKELEEKIFKSFNKIRIYTKEPGRKRADEKPMMLVPNNTIKEAAERALHSKAKNVLCAKIWGPSSKFAGQRVGLKHILKDKDIVEFNVK